MTICGIDEAGRGPLAGPVTAAAVILPDDFPFEILNDSKKMSKTKRESVVKIIKEKAIEWSVANVSHKKIDEINIHHASLLAMKKSFLKLKTNIDLVQVDGKYPPELEVKTEAIIKGDSKIHQIMAASIIAKTERDSLMVKIAKKYPLWLLDKHKGYPTKLHRELCIKHGISPVHRKSFRIKNPNG